MRSTGAIESVSNLKDLAEYFESADGAKIEASYLVALEGDKIRKAQEGDKILGVVSKTAGVVLGGAAFYCDSKYSAKSFKFDTLSIAPVDRTVPPFAFNSIFLLVSEALPFPWPKTIV